MPRKDAAACAPATFQKRRRHAINRYGDFDDFAQNEVYNWKVTLTLSGEEADEIQSANPFCTGPRQFCGHVTLVR